ncbi:MAG: aldo/keto reductase [Methylotenera sp.]|nr:aldo/keto reductase [Oligoflexia bacterium]
MGATLQGTKTYFQTHPLAGAAKPPVVLGKTGFSVSPVGFGGYRVYDTNSDHTAALKLAIESGCNLIDTSTNYTNGASEKAIGKVLAQLFAEKKITREQVVVVTKIGYVQGENMEHVQARLAQRQPFSEMVEVHEDCWHCISPDFLKDQITRSLKRLGLDQIDVLLLHNPEYFLKKNPDHSEYYRRIQQAFEYLETEVAAGRIQYYGISSNTFVEPKDHPHYTSFETTLTKAEELTHDNHYAVIQFPMNLYEPGAVLEENNSGQCVVEMAREENIGTLVNRPLNAFFGKQMIRLADFPSHHGMDTVGLLKNAFTAAMELEARYPGKAVLPAQNIAWGHIIKENISKLSDLDNWKQVLAHQIRPTLAQAYEKLAPHAEMKDWTEKYVRVAEVLFLAFTAFLESQAAMRSQQTKADLDQVVPALKTSPTLTQKAVRIYRSIPGIHCVLVGMRQVAYVKNILDLQPALDPQDALDALGAVQARNEGSDAALDESHVSEGETEH